MFAVSYHSPVVSPPHPSNPLPDAADEPFALDATPRYTRFFFRPPPTLTRRISRGPCLPPAQQVRRVAQSPRSRPPASGHHVTTAVTGSVGCSFRPTRFSFCLGGCRLRVSVDTDRRTRQPVTGNRAVLQIMQRGRYDLRGL